MKLVPWLALLVALVYFIVMSSVLASITGDAEEISLAWLVFGFPAIFFARGLTAIAINAGLPR
ncbi:MAG: hypothetical protein LAO79_26910 [Acidobacteriia bacterium]|nr:hypothetical protein [Terriglobia bacterium]